MFENIILREENDVVVVTLNRPKRNNALSVKLLEELNKAMEDIEHRNDLRAVVITGGDKVFCAGADITMFPGLKTAEEAFNFVERFKYLLGSVKRLSKPVIAAVCGYALGGGMELFLNCDMRIAAEEASFGLPEVDLGAFPAAGGTQVLPRLIGAALAKEMLLIGKPMDARDAYRLGLLNKICKKEEVIGEALKMAKELAGKPSYAVRTMKRIVDIGMEMDITRALSYESSNFIGIWASDDFKEGYTSFLEKRRPSFKGR